MSEATTGEATGVIKFTVMNLAGDATLYRADSIEHLRVQLAIEHEVFEPCIEFFIPPSFNIEDRVDDADDVERRFGASSQPYALNFINNNESVKGDMKTWSGGYWLDTLESHVRHGDKNP